MTRTDISTAAGATVERYLTFWNTAPGSEQLRLATAVAVFREDVDHRDPLGARTGIDEVLQLSRDFAEHLGDLTFRARCGAGTFSGDFHSGTLEAGRTGGQCRCAPSERFARDGVWVESEGVDTPRWLRRSLYIVRGPRLPVETDAGRGSMRCR
jgi:hypothetical protein